MPFDISLYNEEFFEWHLRYAREYSIKTMDWYIDTYKPKSVADFGCGIGSYLESAFNKGLRIQGYEISSTARKYTPETIQPFIKYVDCTTPLSTAVYDCVISFETAEHISPRGTWQFVDNIMKACGGILLFTAAPPGQQGTGHINLRSKEYWLKKFSSLKYEPDLTDSVRLNWKQLGAPEYICNNLITFTP